MHRSDHRFLKIGINRDNGNNAFLARVALADLPCKRLPDIFRQHIDIAAKMGINYPILIDDGKVSNLYGPVRSIPTTFIIGKDMKIVKMYIGAKDKATFKNDIKELLK